MKNSENLRHNLELLIGIVLFLVICFVGCTVLLYILLFVGFILKTVVPFIWPILGSVIISLWVWAMIEWMVEDRYNVWIRGCREDPDDISYIAIPVTFIIAFIIAVGTNILKPTFGVFAVIIALRIVSNILNNFYPDLLLQKRKDYIKGTIWLIALMAWCYLFYVCIFHTEWLIPK
jgi:energy-coupling factor transporter transmembrane protein EcfT